MVTTTVIFLVAALSLSTAASAQSLADVAKKTEDERAKAKQGPPAKVFTNGDLVEVPPARVPPPVTSTADPRDTSSIETPALIPARNAPDTKPTGAVHDSRTYTANGNAVETTLTLRLRGRQGNQLPIDLLFRAVHEDRSRANEPSDLTLQFAVGWRFMGAFDSKPPHAAFVIDEDLATADAFAFVISGPLGGTIPSVALDPFDLAFLARLAQATTLRGRLFNFEFVMTPDQVRSISEFSERARRRPKGPA